MNTRSIAAPLVALALLSAIGCASSTRVELESASAPAVQLADGGDGQIDVGVVDAGVIEIADEPTEATTTTSDPVPTPDEPKTEVDDATKQRCRDEKHTLKTAIDDYRADLGMSPTSEGDLIAFAYVRAASDVYDVRVDGSLVAQGTTCLGVR